MTDRTTPASPEPSQSGAELLRVVEIMDQLRSPGGCPWDAEQTHSSLGRYLVEECYELLQAIDDGDRVAIREELGDVLLQVLFHARIASELPRGAGGFDIDEVASGLANKLVRRHPDVFGDTGGAVGTAADQQLRWDDLKKAEAGRASVLAGVAMGQPSLALAAKLGSRARGSQISVALPTGDSTAEQLFRLAYRAGARGEDPESELRAVATVFARRLAAAEERSDELSGPADRIDPSIS